jgi:hypothetical protein
MVVTYSLFVRSCGGPTFAPTPSIPCPRDTAGRTAATVTTRGALTLPGERKWIVSGSDRERKWGRRPGAGASRRAAQGHASVVWWRFGCGPIVRHRESPASPRTPLAFCGEGAVASGTAGSGCGCDAPPRWACNSSQPRPSRCVWVWCAVICYAGRLSPGRRHYLPLGSRHVPPLNTQPTVLSCTWGAVASGTAGGTRSAMGVRIVPAAPPRPRAARILDPLWYPAPGRGGEWHSGKASHTDTPNRDGRANRPSRADLRLS